MIGRLVRLAILPDHPPPRQPRLSPIEQPRQPPVTNWHWSCCASFLYHPTTNSRSGSSETPLKMPRKEAGRAS